MEKERVCLDFVINEKGEVYLEQWVENTQYLTRVDDLVATKFKDLVLTDINDSL